jgi:hypothetical protein
MTEPGIARAAAGTGLTTQTPADTSGSRPRRQGVKAIKGRRDDVQLATKFLNERGPDGGSYLPVTCGP